VLRIGHGFDLHRLVQGRALFLGGVDIPTDGFGLLGHSDADVLLHAVTDAILGALALGDIGQWFPDTDPAYRGIASEKLLQIVLEHQDVSGWRVVNLDTTILAEAPRLAPHIPEIRQSIARILKTSPGTVSVKATTTEQTGTIGRGEAIAVHAVILLEHENSSCVACDTR